MIPRFVISEQRFKQGPVSLSGSGAAKAVTNDVHLWFGRPVLRNIREQTGIKEK